MSAPEEYNEAHLLVVDGDQQIRVLLQKYLSRNGFLVTGARDAAHARRLLGGLEFDMLVIDAAIPDEDGFSLTRDLRSAISTPILLLTAQSDAGNRGKELDQGADDYLPKPFEPKELLVRVNAILQRTPKSDVVTEPPKTLQMAEVRYDVTRGELWNGEERIRLTSTENTLMKIFAAHPHESISRSRLVNDLGRGDGSAHERAIDVQITRLRRKLETNPKQPRYLQTVRGTGYMLAPD